MDDKDNAGASSETTTTGKGTSKMSCMHCRGLPGKMDELQESMYQLHTKLKQMEAKNAQYHTAIIGALEELKTFSNQLMKQEASASGVDSYFPLKSEEEIMEVEALISDENKNLYLHLANCGATMSAKNLKNVLNENIISEFNIPGSHGKKRLLSFPKLFEVLLDSILNLPSTKAQDPEHLLRNAWQLSKKKKIATKNNNN